MLGLRLLGDVVCDSTEGAAGPVLERSRECSPGYIPSAKKKRSALRKLPKRISVPCQHPASLGRLRSDKDLNLGGGDLQPGERDRRGKAGLADLSWLVGWIGAVRRARAG